MQAGAARPGLQAGSPSRAWEWPSVEGNAVRCRDRRFISSHLHCSSKGTFPSVVQAGLPLSRQIFPLKHWLSRPCLSLQLPPHTPSLAPLLCLQSLSHSALPGRRAGWHWECCMERSWTLHPATGHWHCWLCPEPMHSVTVPAGQELLSPANPTPCLPPGPPWDINTVTSKGRAGLLPVSLELLGGGQGLVTRTLHAGRSGFVAFTGSWHSQGAFPWGSAAASRCSSIPDDPASQSWDVQSGKLGSFCWEYKPPWRILWI